MRREVMRDDIPRGGQPLQNEIHPDNAEIVEAELQRRLEMVNARLTRVQYWRLQRRMDRLARILIRRGYNQLINQRQSLWTRLIDIKAKWPMLAPSVRQLYAIEGKRLIEQGREVNRQLDDLLPLAAEYDAVKAKLLSHNEAKAWLIEDRENHQAFRREAITWLEQIRAVMRHSERLRHRWQDEQGKWHTDIPQFERMIFKDDRVYYHVATTRQGLIERLLGRWHSALPDDVDVTDLTSDVTLANLSAACRRRVTFEWSKRGTNLYYVISRLDSPDGIPARVLYSQTMDWYPTEQHIKTPWVCGVTEDRKVVYYDFATYPHVLIAGSTQSGKSNLVNAQIASIVTMHNTREVRIMLADLKGGIEFTHWKGVKHLIGDIMTTPDQLLSGLTTLTNLLERRLKILESAKAKDILTYNKKARDKLPRVIFYIDEMATLVGIGEIKQAIDNHLRVLSAQGRAAGIHIVACTQHPSVDVIPGWIKTNMALRICGKVPGRIPSEIVLDTGTAATLPPIPGRIVTSPGRMETIMQSPYISDAEIARAVTISQQYDDPDDEMIFEMNAIAPTVFTKGEMLDMVIDEMDGYLSANRLHEVLGNDIISLRKLRDMITGVIASGQKGVNHRGVTYDIRRDKKAYVLVERKNEREMGA